jgi:hypothetical protein
VRSSAPRARFRPSARPASSPSRTTSSGARACGRTGIARRGSYRP